MRKVTYNIRVSQDVWEAVHNHKTWMREMQGKFFSMNDAIRDLFDIGEEKVVVDNVTTVEINEINSLG